MTAKTRIRVKDTYSDKKYAGRTGILDHETTMGNKKFCLVDFTNNGVIPESGVVTLTMIRKDVVDVVD